MSRRKGEYIAGEARVKREAPAPNRVPREQITIKMKSWVVEMLRLGAEYHGVRYQVYMQWLVEQILKEEIHYYGWEPIKARILGPDYTPSKEERRDIVRLQRKAERRVRKAAELREKAKTPSDAPPT
jgi:hypothetical protein